MTFTPFAQFYKKYEHWILIGAFCAGFIFDTLVLHRIDEIEVILQQVAYLLISGALIFIEIIETVRTVEPPWLLKKVWRYREFLLQFLLGTLLNSYTIFYFKSASAFLSFLFIVILITLILLNEFLRFGKSQAQVHMALWSFCLVSFMQCLAPIVLGFIGSLPFLCALFFSILSFLAYYFLLSRKIADHPLTLNTHALYPYMSIQSLFVVLYLAQAIPPVPLSVPYMGIYHEIHKSHGEYELIYTRSKWKFWQNGDQTFLARPGDSIVCYAQVFSPARFKERLQVRWLFWNDKQGWVSSDAIPLQILGGREEGYRILTKKSNYQPGLWRARIETSNNQEIGRINFTVVKDESTEPREKHVEVR